MAVSGIGMDHSGHRTAGRGLQVTDGMESLNKNWGGFTVPARVGQLPLPLVGEEPQNGRRPCGSTKSTILSVLTGMVL